MTFGSNFSWVCLIMSQRKTLTQVFVSVRLYQHLGPEQLIWTVDSSSAEPIFCKVAAALSILLNLCLHFLELCPCQPTSAYLTDEIQHVEIVDCLSRKLCPWRFGSQSSSCSVRWGTVAVAPIMNVVFPPSISTALDLLASHRQEETLQWNDVKACWRQRSSPTGSVWISQEGLDNGV